MLQPLAEQNHSESRELSDSESTNQIEQVAFATPSATELSSKTPISTAASVSSTSEPSSSSFESDTASDSHHIKVFVKSLAGDVLSLNCSADDSLLQLKRQIAAAAATQLGLDWPVSQQQLIRMPNAESDGASGVAVAVGDDGNDGVFRGDLDSNSLQSLYIGDGDVLALLIEEPRKMDVVDFPWNVRLGSPDPTNPMMMMMMIQAERWTRMMKRL
jgi:hypothetical protein